VHGLGAKSLGTEPAMIGKPDLGLHLTFADLAELKTFFREGIALLQKLLLKAENQAPQLTPEESRCADLMNRMWPPDGKPPPELLGKRKEIETAVIAWCNEHNEIAPKVDIIGRTLIKRGPGYSIRLS
jgi:hypothetical protein